MFSFQMSFPPLQLVLIMRRREISTDSTIRNRTKICLKRNEQPSHLNLVQLVLIITNFKWLYHIKTHMIKFIGSKLCAVADPGFPRRGAPTPEFEANPLYGKIFAENRIKN